MVENKLVTVETTLIMWWPRAPLRVCESHLHTHTWTGETSLPSRQFVLFIRSPYLLTFCGKAGTQKQVETKLSRRIGNCGKPPSTWRLFSIRFETWNGAVHCQRPHLPYIRTLRAHVVPTISVLYLYPLWPSSKLAHIFTTNWTNMR